MNGPEANKIVENLSAEDSRFLILILKNHIQHVDATMTPTELHEYLKEMPDDLFREALDLKWELESKMYDLVTAYVVRHGDWTRDEYYEDFTDENTGEVDERKIDDEFCEEISRLSDELLAELFSPEEIEA